ncbi:MAG: methylenetetrahydrofolate--tRNA-(uracil-5-)-methyltransferase [Kiritimatiellia bacterium]|jgi:methylenetetrahydrofolate--tRNA-(uracil-5-)-methyltransferase
MNKRALQIIGAGLSGSEAAWQAAERGIHVRLFEMRPGRSTGAHVTGDCAELVCSNSLGSNMRDRASGLLKEEMRLMDSLLLRCAEETSVPAGGCLAVDREGFARKVTEALNAHPLIELVQEEVTHIPDEACIIASGPLTSDQLSQSIAALTGDEHLYFYDAISPIISVDSIDMTQAYRASRWDRGERDGGDYINCPLNKEEYEAFVDALISAERIVLESFERDITTGVKAGLHTFFEGCMPVEILATRGKDALAYGPMRPVGLDDPRTGRRPHAVVQLRQDNLADTCYNMVGFQTNLMFPEQKRVFGMIPGLQQADYLRYGQMHRNTFIHAPTQLRNTLQHHQRDDLLFAGQITGVEGYAGNIATGLLAGINAARILQGQAPWALPESTMLGSLCHYVTHARPEDFQPMKANFGIVPPLEKKVKGKRERATLYADRALSDLKSHLAENG